MDILVSKLSKSIDNISPIRLFAAVLTLWVLGGAAVDIKKIWWGRLDWETLLNSWNLAVFILYSLIAGLGLVSVVTVIALPGKDVFFLDLKERFGWGRWLLIAGLSAFPAWFIFYTDWSLEFTGYYLRILIFLSSVIIIAILTNLDPNPIEWKGLAVGLILVGTFAAIAASFRYVVDYPFSLYWSEGNRMWDYSIKYGRDLYDYPSDKRIPAFIDIGRQGLWGLPFLFSNISIVAMRTWDALVFTLPYVILGLAAFFQKNQKLGLWILSGLAVFIILNQGPIYTPLVLSAILVVGAVRAPKGLALLLILLAAIYAQATRYTWMFAPAIWSGVLYLGYSRLKEKEVNLASWLWAGGYTLTGVIGGYFIPRLNIVKRYFPRIYTSPVKDVIEDNQIFDLFPFETGVGGQQINNSLFLRDLSDYIKLPNQALLWSRLLPNPTYGPGIILGLLITVGPLLLLLVYLSRSGIWKLNNLYKVGLVGSLAAFLGVGLIISIKIGGGSNLHNLDMFLIGVVLVSVIALYKIDHKKLSEVISRNNILKILVLLVFAVPAFMPLINGKPLKLPNPELTDEFLDDIREKVDTAKLKGDVLFMDQRQLLTFGYINDVPLVPEFEKKLVMDKALSNDIEYFNYFYTMLANHQYSLIISDVHKINYLGENFSFGEENDVWVNWVSVPLLCYYEPLVTYSEIEVQLLVPRSDPQPCN